MCGPSSALKTLNKTIQDFSTQVTSEAGTVFGAANSVFNNLIGGLQKIVQGGPSQTGFSEAELNAKNATAVEGGATMARNLKGAVASGTAAIGGGNTVTPSGGTEASILSAEEVAAQQTASAENQVVQQDYEQGNKNYEAAVGQEMQLPSVYGVADQFNKTASSAQQTAQKSQQEMDTASNWWQPLLMKGVTAGLGIATGGISSALKGGMGNTSSDSSFGENVGNFFSGIGGGTTTPGQ